MSLDRLVVLDHAPAADNRHFITVSPVCLIRGWAMIEAAATYGHSARCIVRSGRTTARSRWLDAWRSAADKASRGNCSGPLRRGSLILG